MKASKTESIREAIMKAIDIKDTECALELVKDWESRFPLEKEGRSMFYFTKLQVLLKCLEAARNEDERVRYLSKAIETGNLFFAANENEGFPMDSEAEEMWFNLIDSSAELISFYSENAYDEDDEDEDESFEVGQRNIFSEALYDRIGRINRPNLKPKPPRKYDGSLKSRLLKAIDCHMEDFGDLDSCNMNLITNICETLDIDSEDLLNSIYNY
ncbi:MAG: hypothetical protein K2L00_07410 [Muribaculaceae bacterium]|nr:hypothetical protein [Muribaculaceae bacterium]